MIKRQIETELPIVLTNHCLQTVTDTEFGISEPNKDKGGKCEVVTKEGADFEVNNPQQKELTFWAIDDCTFLSSDGKRCDFAIFDDQTFAFAEIKRSRYKNRSEAKNKAIEQLAEILNFSKDKIDFSNHKLLAIMALTFAKSMPVASTKKQEARLLFFQKYKAELLEGNGITFPYEP